MTTPTIRSTTTGFANAASFTATLPVGTTAGDTALFLIGGGFGISGLPDASWTMLNNSGTATNLNGSSFWKELVSTDITAGSVTVNFAGTYWFSWTLIIFVGSAKPRFNNTYAQHSSGALSRTLVSGTTVKTGDLVLLHSAQRSTSASANSISPGTVQTAQFGNDLCSSVINQYVPAADGSFTGTFTYAVAGVADFQQIVSVGPVTSEMDTSRVSVGAVAQWLPASMFTSRVAIGAVVWNTSGYMETSRVSIGVVVNVPTNSRRRQSGFIN